MGPVSKVQNKATSHDEMNPKVKGKVPSLHI